MRPPPGTHPGNGGTATIFDTEALIKFMQDYRSGLSHNGQTWLSRVRRRNQSPLTRTVKKYLGEVGLTLDDLPASCFAKGVR